MVQDLYYTRPRPSDIAIHRALHTIQESDEEFAKFLEDPEGFLRNAGVTDPEIIRLLVERDWDALVDRGIYGVLVLQVQRKVEWSVTMDSGKDQ